MKRKIFVGVLCVIVLLLAFVWQLAAGGVTVGPRVDEVGGDSTTLWSYMAGDIIWQPDGDIGPGWQFAWRPWRLLPPYGVLTFKEIGGAGTDLNVETWIMNDHKYLYIALRWPDAQDNAGDSCVIYFDEEHDGQLIDPYEDQEDWVEEGVRNQYSEDFKSMFRALRPGPPPQLIITYRTDGYWSGSTWATERGGMIIMIPPLPTASLDLDAAWAHNSTTEEWTSEWRIPLNSHDRYDINVKSGCKLGVYIKIRNGASGQVWAYGSPLQTGADEEDHPWAWDPLLTKKVFSATIPHVHDDVAFWRAFIGAQNTGTRESRVHFRFSDGWGRNVTLAPGEHMGAFVKDLHAYWDGSAWVGVNFLGSIQVYSDQPFTAEMSQRNAAKTIMGQTVYVGEN